MTIKTYYQSFCSNTACNWHSRKFLSPEPANHYGMTHEMNTRQSGCYTEVKELEVTK